MQLTTCIKLIFILKLIFGMPLYPQAVETSHVFGENLREVLHEIKAEADYRTIFLQRRQMEDCVDPSIVKHFNVPTVIWNEKPYGDILYDYGRHILVILCLKSIEDEEMLQELAVSLRFVRTARILCIVNEPMEHFSELKILNFFEMCVQLEMINIFIFHRDSFIFEIFHSYTKYPNFELGTHYMNKNGEKSRWFPERLKNLFGANLTALPDLHIHRAFIERDVDGNVQYCGCFAKFAQTFCDYLNASLIVLTNSDLNISGELDTIAVTSALASNLIDFGLEFQPNYYSGPSRVLEMTKLGISVPMEVMPPISALFNVFLNRYTILPFVLQTVILPFFISKFMQWIDGKWQPASVWLALGFIGDTGLRSFVGQSLNMPQRQTVKTQFLFSLLLFGGLFIQTYFSANYLQLQTFPPLRPKVANYEEALQSGYKIYVSSLPIIDFMASEEIKQKYYSLFIENREIYQKPIDLLGGDGYLIDRETFEMFLPHNSRIILNENMDVTDLIFFTFMVKYEALFVQPLDDFVDIVQESGLYKYWQQNPCKWRRVTFYDEKFDESIEAQRPLAVSDLNGVWLILICAHFICAFVFLCELFGGPFLEFLRNQRVSN